MDVLAGVSVAMLCTGLGWLCRAWGDLSVFIVIFLVGAVLTALWRGRLASASSVVLGMLSFDYFFETPAYSLTVANWPNFIVFVGFLGIAQLVAGLVHNLREQTSEARRREQETAVLYALTKALSIQSSPEGLREAAGLVLTDLMKVPIQIKPPGAVDSDHFAIPLSGSKGELGVLVAGGLDPARCGGLLEVCAQQIALALERALFAEEAELAHMKAEVEQTRSTLLSSVSHDFRTPLSTIKATATILLQEGDSFSSQERLDLLGLVATESERLDHLVGNLLDLTRLEGGTLVPKIEPQLLEEVVGTVLTRIEPILGMIDVDMPDDLPQIPLDSVLIEQLLTNLLENSHRHGAPSGIQLKARIKNDELVVEVSDSGLGIPEPLRERVFEKFYSTSGHSADGGTGLGLAICRAIVRLHGGRIWIESSKGGGASVVFTIPLNPDAQGVVEPR